MPARKKDYLQNSLRWPFRLYTRTEAMELLRVSSSTFWKMQKKGIVTPLIRRDGKRCPGMKGLTFYTDLQIYKAINYMFEVIPQKEREAIAKALFTVRENHYRVCPWMK